MNVTEAFFCSSQMSTDRFGRDNSAPKRHRGASLPIDESMQCGGASSSRGPAVGNAMLPEASVRLPMASSTQEDLALFAEADAIFLQQQAEIGMMAPLANTQYLGTLPTTIDPTWSFRFSPYGSSASAADVATIFPDTVQVFPLDVDDGVPATHVNTIQKRATFHRTKKHIYRLRRLIRRLLRLRFR